jgi:hypothetical protein
VEDEEFDSPMGLNHDLLEPIDDEAKAFARTIVETMTLEKLPEEEKGTEGLSESVGEED